MERRTRLDRIDRLSEKNGFNGSLPARANVFYVSRKNRGAAVAAELWLVSYECGASHKFSGEESRP